MQGKSRATVKEEEEEEEIKVGFKEKGHSLIPIFLEKLRGSRKSSNQRRIRCIKMMGFIFGTRNIYKN
jgi:hypothetical protein